MELRVLTREDLRWKVKVSGYKVESSQTRFFTGFLPSFFRSIKCYSWIDSSFLICEYFCKDLKNQRRAWFSLKYAVEGTANSMEQRLEFFVKLMAKNSISHEKLSDRLLLLIILHGNMMNLLNLWIARQRRNSSTFVFRAGIFIRVWGPGIDSKEWIPPAYVAWQVGTITLCLFGS
jgi:hypothetical protein